jgi:thiosulfate reductase cytochrome b subunit
MAQTAYAPGLAVRGSEALDLPRHSAVIRITHWITTIAFIGLLVSGIAILIAHPRLYWGETGGVGAPSLIDLPIPFMIGHSGWGRYLHFLCVWIAVLTGFVYVGSSLINGHFRDNLLPAKRDLNSRSMWRIIWAEVRWKRTPEGEALSYNVVQRLAYLTIIFVVFPLIILTGLAMSPALASVLPALRESFGGQQSARTLHFFLSAALVLFVCVHVAMVCLAGFASRVRAMITGRAAAGKEVS